MPHDLGARPISQDVGNCLHRFQIHRRRRMSILHLAGNVYIMDGVRPRKIQAVLRKRRKHCDAHEQKENDHPSAAPRKAGATRTAFEMCFTIHFVRDREFERPRAPVRYRGLRRELLS